jgi:hypothetical protein
MNWGVVAGVALILYILYAIFVPPKWYRDKLYEDDALKAKREARKYVRNVVKGMVIHAVQFDRGHTSGILTKRTPQVFIFHGIIRGDFSETLYLRVDQDGNVFEYETDIAANAAIQQTDFGIVAVTASDGQIRFRDVVPTGSSDRDLYKLRFNFLTSS